MKFQDKLNPKLWEGFNLKPEVADKLEEISEAFVEFLSIPEDAVQDIRITGSSANYNYNDLSDLDLHLIIDYDKLHEDCPLVEGYLWGYKSQFNDNHDISIYGIPVEVYAENMNQPAVSNGTYSLVQGDWIHQPEKIEPTDNDAAVEAKYQELKQMVDNCDDSEEAQNILDKIYDMRKVGLADAGEFSTENLAFKKLRNEGCMNKLRKLKKEKIDKQLSLESYSESNRKDRLYKPYDGFIWEQSDKGNSYTVYSAFDGGQYNYIGYISFNYYNKELNLVRLEVLRKLGDEMEYTPIFSKKYQKDEKSLKEMEDEIEAIIKTDHSEQIDKQLSLESYNEEITDDQLLSGAKFMMQGYGVKSIKPGQYTITIFDSQENDSPINGKQTFVYPTIDKAKEAYNKFINKYAKVILQKYTDNGYEMIKKQDKDTEFNRTYKYSSPEAFKKSIEDFRQDKNFIVDDIIEGKDLLHVVYKLVNGNKEHYCTFNNTTLERYYDINESIKESLQDEYKQAFDLLIEGENIVGTLDTDFGKQFIKDVENLYKLKSYKLKLSVAKEMLKDIQGYLVDEQYDCYNAKIDKFMNNSKNESIKESEERIYNHPGYYIEDSCRIVDNTYTNVDLVESMKRLNKKLEKIHEDVIPAILDNTIIKYGSELDDESFEKLVTELSKLIKNHRFITYRDLKDELTQWRYTDEMINKLFAEVEKRSGIKNNMVEAVEIETKNPGILEVPEGKNVEDLPQSHFEKLVKKKGYEEIIRALTNLEVWNKNKNKPLSRWASNMVDKLKKKFRPESAQKNEGLLDKLFSKRLTNDKFRKLVKDYTSKSNPRDFALNILSKLPDNTIISYKIKDKQNYFKKVDDNWWKSKNRDKLLDYEIARELVGSYIYQIPLFDVVELNYANESAQKNESLTESMKKLNKRFDSLLS